MTAPVRLCEVPDFPARPAAACTLRARFRMRTRRSLVLAILLLLAALLLAATVLPVRYEATARVLLPLQIDAAAFADAAAAYDVAVDAGSRSRVLSLRHAAADPARAAGAVNAFLRARVSEGMVIVDEANVPFASLGPGRQTRAGLAGAAVALCIFVLALFKRKSASKAPEREVVRYALRFAQLGQKTLLVETGTRFRVVLSGDAAAALEPELEILARLAGGALTVARTL